MDINISEITSKNCYKCDLETTIDNNSQYFWINLREFEVNETERKWFNIFNKHGKQVIKSCKTTNIEFTMLKKNSAYVFMKKIIIQKRSYKYKIILK